MKISLDCPFNLNFGIFFPPFFGARFATCYPLLQFLTWKSCHMVFERETDVLLSLFYYQSSIFGFAILFSNSGVNTLPISSLIPDLDILPPSSLLPDLDILPASSIIQRLKLLSHSSLKEIRIFLMSLL
jgi:hypothetical protein